MLVNINIDVSAGIVTIHGPQPMVIVASNEVQTKLRNILAQRGVKKQAAELVKFVQWNYEEITTTECVLKPYDEITNHKIEMAFTANEKRVHFLDEDKEKFEIDFKTLKEYPLSDTTDKLRVVRKYIYASKSESINDLWVVNERSEI